MTLAQKIQSAGILYNNYGRKQPLVLNIEMSHLCNLKCIHCGRIRDDVTEKLTNEKAMAAIDEVDPPIVYLTGGEPFLFVDDLNVLVNYALKQDKVVFIVTNGTLLTKQLEKLQVEDKSNLVLMFSVDGLEESHDVIRGKNSFRKMKEGMQKAKELGFDNRWINFTIFKSNQHEFERVVEEFGDLVDRTQLNIYFPFLEHTPEIDEGLEDISKRAIALRAKYGDKIFNSYTYFEMWAGKYDLDCTPWGTVTLDGKGWRSPCYFLDEGHYRSYSELMEQTDWETYIKKRKPECSSCKAHCGFEPTVYGDKKLLAGEVLKTLKYAFRKPQGVGIISSQEKEHSPFDVIHD